VTDAELSLDTARRGRPRRGCSTISSTEVHGRIALRLCIDNLRTTVEDVESTIARLAALATDAPVV
jgi:hypothetical protein